MAMEAGGVLLLTFFPQRIPSCLWASPIQVEEMGLQRLGVYIATLLGLQSLTVFSCGRDEFQISLVSHLPNCHSVY